MASGFLTSHLRGSLIQSEVRVVLLGDTRADQVEVVKSILGCKILDCERFGLCTLYRGEEAGRKISVVETPGWNRSLIQQTADSVKAEIVRSVSLCPPGPDALLLVLPVKNLSEESSSEFTEAKNHMELLSERVWKHTIVLFDCDEGVEESVLQEHIRSAGQISEKCRGRCHVLRRNAGQTSELFKKIEHLVEENKGFFIPQNVFEVIQPKTEVVEGGIRQRRGSLEKDRPSFEKEIVDSDEKKQTVEVVKHTFLALDKSLIPFSMILMTIVGALIGSVAGAEHGVLGACVGLVCGIIVGILLAILIMYIYTQIYSHFNPNQPTR